MSCCREHIPTCQLREQLRKYRGSQRTAKREYEVDCLRLGLGDIQSAIEETENLSVEHVENICFKIKRKKRASEDDMFRLGLAFLQGSENINAFVNNVGAINILVKELTGHDAESQIRSCEALCNLSLGEATPCEKIALYAGSYLVTYLDSTDVRLKTTSLWTVTNIAATGGRGVKTLISLEIVAKLLNLWNTEKDGRIIHDIAIAINFIASLNVLRPQDKDNLRKTMLAKRPGSAFDEYYLKIIFESLVRKDLHLTENEIFHYINFCMYNMTHITEFLMNSKILRVIYSLRILTNLLSLYSAAAGMLVESAISSNVYIPGVVNKLLEKELAVQEVLWFITSFSNCQICEVQIYLHENNFLGELKVGRFNIAKHL